MVDIRWNDFDPEGLFAAAEQASAEIQERERAVRAVSQERASALAERNAAREAEEESREALKRLEDLILDRLPYKYDDGEDDDASPEECVEYAAQEIRFLIRQRDEARVRIGELTEEAKVLREECKSEANAAQRLYEELARTRALLENRTRERDEARSERGERCAACGKPTLAGEDFDGPCVHDSDLACALSQRDEAIADRDRARFACNTQWHDLERIASLCGRTADEYPLKAVERVVRERDEALARYTFRGGYIEDDSGDRWWSSSLLKRTEEERDEALAKASRAEKNFASVAEALDLADRPEGQGGIQVAPAEEIVEFARKAMRRYNQWDDVSESLSMACETPATGCECAGCSYAREKSGAHNQ